MLLKRIIPILVLCLIIGFLFGKTLFPSSGQIIYGGDLQDQFYYWKSFYKESILQGTVPFWNPYNFSGTPFLAHPSVAAFYPLNIIFLLFPISNAFSYFLYVHILIAGIGMYWFARKKWDSMTALSGAIVYSCSGMFAARIFAGHVDIISTLAWIPFVFGSVSEALEHTKKRKILAAIFFLTLQILSGYQFVVILTLLLSLFYTVANVMLNSVQHLERSRNKFGVTLIKNVFIFFFISLSSFGLAAVQLLPTMEFVSHSIRKGGLPYDLTTWGSYTLDTFKLYFSPFVYGNPLPEKYSYFGPGPNYYELSYFVGIIPLVVIGIYAILQFINKLKRKKSDRLFVFGIISFLFFAAMALGNNFFLHRVVYTILPPFRLFRFPSQYLFISVFILSFLTCCAIAALKNKYLKLIIISSIIFELLSFSKPFYRLSPVPTHNFDTNLISTLIRNNSNSVYRMTPDFPVISFVRKSLDLEAANYYSFHSTGGYNPLILDSYHRFITLINNASSDSLKSFNVETPPPDPNKKAFEFLSVKYVLWDPSWNTFYKGVPIGYEPVLERSQFTLFENKNVAPRFFLVNEIQIKNSNKEIEDELRKDLDLRSMLYINQNNDAAISDLTCLSQFEGNVKVLDYGINQIKLLTSSNCNGYLSTSEVYYPGWETKIDGIHSKLLQTNLAFRGVYIPKGEHTVIMYYEPRIYYFGFTISVFSFLCIFFILRKPKFS